MRYRHASALVLVSALAFAGAAQPAGAHSYSHGALRIGHPWAQPSAGPDGAAFFAGVNRGETAERLVAARTPVAREVVFRVPRDQAAPAKGVFGRAVDAVRRLWSDDEPFVAVDALAFPPGGPMPMRPGGTHLALVTLDRPLVEGARFALTLVFSESGPITVEIHVEDAPGG